MKPVRSSTRSWRIATWLFLVALLGVGGILLVLANRIPSRVAPAGIVWEIRDHNPSDGFDKPGGVLIAPSGDIILFGSGRILKYDGTAGKKRWRIPSNAQVLAIDAHGDLYAANASGIVLCKYSGENGKLIWKESYGGSRRCWVQGIALDSSGNPVIAGFSPTDTRYYSYLAKHNALDGRLIWKHEGEDEPAAELWHGSFGMKIAPNDDVVFVSSTKEQEPGGFTGQCFIQRFRGRDGHHIWTQRVRAKPGTADSSQSMDLDSEGNVLVAGYSSDGRRHITVIWKFRSFDGELMWSSPYGIRADGANLPSAILVDRSGNVIVCVNWRDLNSSHESHTLKYAGNDGQLLWKQVRSVPSDSSIVAEACVGLKLFMDSRGALVLAGNRWNGSNIDYHLAWVSGADGSVSYQISYDGPANDHDMLHDVAFAPGGEIYAAGSSSNCTEWLKPYKNFSRIILNLESYSGIHRESNHVFDDDPYNYDIMMVKFPPVPVEESN